jgi:hypothetical protein
MPAGFLNWQQLVLLSMIMDCTSTHIPHKETGYFSKIVLDYLAEELPLKPFYQHPVSLQGMRDAIDARKQFSTNRPLLVQELQKQYADISTSEKVKENIWHYWMKIHSLSSLHINQIFLLAISISFTKYYIL